MDLTVYGYPLGYLTFQQGMTTQGYCGVRPTRFILEQTRVRKERGMTRQWSSWSHRRGTVRLCRLYYRAIETQSNNLIGRALSTRVGDDDLILLGPRWLKILEWSSRADKRVDAASPSYSIPLAYILKGIEAKNK